MKAFVLVFVLIIRVGVSPLGTQSTTATQTQKDVDELYGRPINLGETIRIRAEGRAEQQVEDRQIIALTQMTDTVNAGDAKGYARLYAQDAVITIYGGTELKGQRSIEDYEAELMREFPGARFAIYSVWQQRALAVVHYGVTGRTAGGQVMGHEGLLFYRFDPSGLIQEERRYLDSLTPMAQMGLLGSAPARALPKLPTAIKMRIANRSPNEVENIALVRASFRALDSKNESEFLSMLAQDAVVDELILPQPFIRKNNIEAWFQTWSKAVPDASTEITSLLSVGEFVLLECIMRGTLRGALGRLAGSNTPFRVHRAAIIQVKNGKLGRISLFMNGKELAEAVSQWPPRNRR
jgi:ketosteroid isomerase-like protein